MATKVERGSEYPALLGTVTEYLAYSVGISEVDAHAFAGGIVDLILAGQQSTIAATTKPRDSRFTNAENAIAALLALCDQVDAEAVACHGAGREGTLGTSVVRDAIASATVTDEGDLARIARKLVLAAVEDAPYLTIQEMQPDLSELDAAVVDGLIRSAIVTVTFPPPDLSALG